MTSSRRSTRLLQKYQGSADTPNQSRVDAPSSVSYNDLLSSLPPETLNAILDTIESSETLARLGRTCKAFYLMALPRLYKRVAVTVHSPKDMSQLITTLEPHLTAARRTHLVKGQRSCADFVRELYVSFSVYGLGHESHSIAIQCMEDAISNMKNVEIFETQLLTEPMMRHLESLKNLRAVCLNTNCQSNRAIKSLANLGNLQHLSLGYQWFGRGYGHGRDILASMLLNSATTLQSMELMANIPRDFADDSNETSSTEATLGTQQRTLSSLKSLKLGNLTFNKETIKFIDTAIDLAGLRELELQSGIRDSVSFYEHFNRLLARLPDPARVGLEKLNVLLSADTRKRALVSPTEASWQALCQFISSFDSMTCLQFTYSQDPTRNVKPEAFDRLVQAILTHQNLTKLVFLPTTARQAHTSGPCLSVNTIATIAKGLPRLKDFRFMPSKYNVSEIAQALSHGRSLEHVFCVTEGGLKHQPPGSLGTHHIDIIVSIIKGFLFSLQSDPRTSNNQPVWEIHYKLRRITVDYITVEVRSNLGQQQNGKEATHKVAVGGGLEVQFQDVSKAWQLVPTGWMDRVSQKF